MSVSLPAKLRLPDFTIAIPANWYALDLNPRTRAATIAALVEQRFGRDSSPMVRQVRRELTEMLRRYAHQAASHGAIYAALMDQVVEGMAISASLVIAVGDAPRDRTGAPVLDPVALGQALIDSEQVGTDAGQPPDPDTVPTLAGAAVRLRRTTGSGFAGRDRQSVATAESQYFLPVPGTDKVLAMTFATPNLPVRAMLDEVFDAIARTLDWVWDSERARV
jgi:hypothetical protein